MNAVDVLRQAKALLADEGVWCKGSPARRADGQMSWTTSGDDIVGFCALGALYRVTNVRYGAMLNEQPRELNEAMSALWTAVRDRVASDVAYVQGFNDDPATTHEQLIDAFDRAILSLAGDTKPEPIREAVAAE